MKLLNLEGKRFGKIKVLRQDTTPRIDFNSKRTKIKWICICDCSPNIEFSVFSSNLIRGHTKSCGCDRLRGVRNPNNTETHRQCCKCKQIIELNYFYKLKQSKSNISGYSYICKSCSSNIRKEKHRNDPRVEILKSAKRRSKILNLNFDISLEDIVIPVRCPLLGIELVVGFDSFKYNSPSLDRLIPEKGYVKENIRVISHEANKIKSNASIEDLLKFAENIKDYLNKRY